VPHNLIQLIGSIEPHSFIQLKCPLCHTTLFNLWGALVPHTLICLIGCTCAAHSYSVYRVHLCQIALFNLQGLLVLRTPIQLTGFTYATHTHTLLSNNFRPPYDNYVFPCHMYAGGQCIFGYFVVNLMTFSELCSCCYGIER